jgi:hypothetical protein
MDDLNEAEVKALAEDIGLNVSEPELSLLVIRLNGMMKLLQPLEALPLDQVEPIPTLFTQWGGS